MKKNPLDCIGYVAPQLIEKAENYTVIPKKKPWIGWIAAAACLILIGGTAFYVSERKPGIGQIPVGPGEETAPPNTASANPPADLYPYNDREVLDYIGMPLEPLQTDQGTILWNEITDIEAYRSLNTVYGAGNQPYYDTSSALLDCLVNHQTGTEEDEIAGCFYKEDGRLENCLHYEAFQTLAEEAPATAELIRRIIEEEQAKDVSGYFMRQSEASGISFSPLVYGKQSNCMVTVLISESLSDLDERLTAMLPIFQGTLGTERSSVINEQECYISYFYQNRQCWDDQTEEAYQYYVYFERDGLQYLCQFFSNWSLPGQNVTALHNPPVIYHYVETQEACRELFTDFLQLLVSG